MSDDLTALTPEAMRAAGMDAIRKAEKARNRADKRRYDIEYEARRHLQVRAHAMLPWWKRIRIDYREMVVDKRLLDAVTDSWCGEDPKWNGAAADNRWYLAQAAAYGANT